MTETITPRQFHESAGVTVRLTTTTPDHFFWLSERDVELARQISAPPGR